MKQHDTGGEPLAGPIAEPIAVIGLACRLPGAADTGQFWDNLVNGVEGIRFYTLDEQRALGVPESIVADPNFVPAAAVLDDYDGIDTRFFGMSVREAEVRDPQHRLLLELSHTALEDAGCDPTRYPGEIGMYATVGPDVYQWLNIRSNPKAYANAGWLAVMVGNHPDYASTLASYKLGMRGPSLTMNTACSSSLVAMHLACESLRSGECDMALTGGATIDIPAGHGYLYDEDGITAPDGHCRTFDVDAKGTIWGSGGGVVVLKRLSDALADADNIRAVVIGNAINNDGDGKVGFSAPSMDGQAAVIAQALGVAGTDPTSISYVEAHGTGTALGDPIEVSALSQVYQRNTDAAGWCAIGSVKTNVGHLGQTAGAAALIKTVLALEHAQIPPSLHFQRPNPKIDFGENPFYVNASLATWETNGGPRRAAVSSFGIGGTNAHAILQQAPELDVGDVAASPEPQPRLLQLSARTDTALADRVQQLADHLAEHRELNLADVAYTLRAGRREMPRRAAVVATGIEDAAEALRDAKRLVTGVAGKQSPWVAFMFSGQGAQYGGMGAGLYRAERAFAAVVDECAELLVAQDDNAIGDIRDVLFAEGGDADQRLRQTSHTQPALFVIEYALARLWQSYGVEPAAMIGHSIGEYVAATVAGVFDLPDALRLVAARGRLMQSMPAGSMLAIRLDETEVRPMLPDGISVATVNGPGTCVVAGPAAEVTAFADRLADDDVGATLLRTSHAFHSSMMEPILPTFRDLVAATERTAPTVPLLSNVTGDWITADEARDPSYWARHLREPVRFGDGVQTLLADGEWSFVECGPGRQLSELVRMQLSREAAAPLPCLPGPRSTGSDIATLLTAVGALWTRGTAFDPESFSAATAPATRKVSLPTYPWERTRAWIEPSPDVAAFSAQTSAVASRSERGGVLPVDRWAWSPTWRQVAPGASTEPPIARCLLFVDEQTAGLGAELRAGGTEVVEVRPGAEFARLEGGYTVRPAERADYDALLEDLAADGGIGDRIVHAWTAGDAPATAPEAVWRAQDRGFFSLLSLVQALAAAEHPDAMRLNILTAGACDLIGSDLVRPEHATVAGISRVVPLELPWLAVTHLDLDPAGSGWAQVVEELAGPPEKDEAGLCPPTAVRGSRRWVAEYQPVELPERTDENRSGLRDGGVYVITGGLGGIGITLAEDMAWRARARVVLLSRSGLPPRFQWDDYLTEHGSADRTGRAIAAVRRIEEAGGEALVLAADVTDAEDLRRVRREATAEFGAINGIVHAAGVPGGGIAEVKERSAAEDVMRPKILGTLALRAVFGELDLDFVVLCSSVTAVAGGLGQVDYCAANAFLDAHARSTGGWGGRVLSVNWGGWLDVGMAAEVQAPDALRALHRGVDAADDGFRAATNSGTPVDHPVLTSRHDSHELPWCAGEVSAATHWVLDEHRMAPVPLMPGTGYVEIARAAAEAALPGRGDGQLIELRDLAFVEPMPVPDGTSAELRVEFTADPDGAEFVVRSSAGGTVSSHARGGAGWVDAGPTPVVDLDAIRARCTQAGGQGGVALSTLLTYGPHWQNLQTWYTGDDEALALLEANDVVAADLHRWVLHPGILDEATSFARFSVEGHYLPLSYGRVVVRAAMPKRMWSHLRFRGGTGAEVIVADVSLLDDSGTEVVSITDYVLRRVDPDTVYTTVTSSAAGAEVSAQEPAAGGSDSSGRGIRPADGAEAFTRLLANRLGAQVVVSAIALPEFVATVGGVNQQAVEALAT
ncbi:MAG: SDR family NAD(P)-dependent oxidoreductase, partial [Thermocrispum sp.]